MSQAAFAAARISMPDDVERPQLLIIIQGSSMHANRSRTCHGRETCGFSMRPSCHVQDINTRGKLTCKFRGVSAPATRAASTVVRIAAHQTKAITRLAQIRCLMLCQQLLIKHARMNIGGDCLHKHGHVRGFDGLLPDGCLRRDVNWPITPVLSCKAA